MCLEQDAYKAIGDTCDHKRECVSTRCTDGKCVGRSVGEWCQKPEWCATNHCEKSKCAPLPATEPPQSQIPLSTEPPTDACDSTDSETSCLTKVTFNVEGNNDSDVIIFKRLKRNGGCGPKKIQFGPGNEPVTVEMCLDTTYVLSSYTINGQEGKADSKEDRGETRDEGSNSDIDVNITPDKGRFKTSTRYYIGCNYPCESRTLPTSQRYWYYK
jgi:hypothetical protein